MQSDYGGFKSHSTRTNGMRFVVDTKFGRLLRVDTSKPRRGCGCRRTHRISYLRPARPTGLNCLVSGDLCEPESNTGIGNFSIRPAPFRCLFRGIEVIFGHLYVDLHASFHGSFLRSLQLRDSGTNAMLHINIFYPRRAGPFHCDFQESSFTRAEC